ncbi:MAG: c-type cytochrome [Bacteroidota bacterium]
MMKRTTATLTLLISIFLVSCGGSGDSGSDASSETSSAPAQEESSGELSAFEQEHGIGPVTELLDIGDGVDTALAEQGQSIFEEKCTACHEMENRLVGPPLGDVTERRSNEFIMNFILNPSGMTEDHPVGKELLAEYTTPMVFQDVSEEDARAILEYFRSVASN